MADKYLAVNIPDLTVLYQAGQPVAALFDGLERVCFTVGQNLDNDALAVFGSTDVDRLDALRQALANMQAGGHRVRARLVTPRFLANRRTFPFPEVSDGQEPPVS